MASDYCVVMNSELERLCKEVVVARFKILHQDLSGQTEEKHERTAEQWVHGPVFQPDPTRSHIRIIVLYRPSTALASVLFTTAQFHKVMLTGWA